jgi:hypothetical protein
MSTYAEVRLWGRIIGAVALESGERVAAFEYDPAFAASGIELAPLTLPLSRRIYRFPELAPNLSRPARPAGRLAAGRLRPRPDRRLAGHPGPPPGVLQRGRAAVLHR